MSKVTTLFGQETVKDVEEVKDTKFNVWSFITDISKTKEYLYDDQTHKAYEPWIVNKSFSAHMDTFVHAEVMNRYHFLDKKMQHDYMFYSIESKSKRYKPWLSKGKDEKAELKLLQDIASYIKQNINKSKFYWSLLTKQQQTDFLSTYIYPDSNNTSKTTKK